MRSATITALVGLLVVCSSSTPAPAGEGTDRAPRPEDFPAIRAVPERDVPPGERLRQLQAARRDQLHRLFQRLANTNDGPTRQRLHGWIQLHKLETEQLLLDELPAVSHADPEILGARREALRTRAALLRARHGEPEIPAPSATAAQGEDQGTDPEGSR